MDNDKFIRKSKITGKEYDVFKSIRILNISQAIYYLENRIELQDLFISQDKKTNKSILVFVFLRDDTKEIFDTWCKRGEKNG